MNHHEEKKWSELVLQDTQAWLERAVIGLNLCPFAKSVHTKGLVRYVVGLESEPVDVLSALERELLQLASESSEVVDTSLLILPKCFAQFLEFNDFLQEVDHLVERLDLAGVIQVASFHPQFQFAGTQENDITNFTNRAPYPVLHLLREESIDRAVESFPQAEAIFEKNMETLQALGHLGWAQLDVGAKASGNSQV